MHAHIAAKQTITHITPFRIVHGKRNVIEVVYTDRAGIRNLSSEGCSRGRWTPSRTADGRTTRCTAGAWKRWRAVGSVGRARHIERQRTHGASKLSQETMPAIGRGGRDRNGTVVSMQYHVIVEVSFSPGQAGGFSTPQKDEGSA